MAATLVVPSALAAETTYTPPEARQRIGLNMGWKFKEADVTGAEKPAFDDTSWDSVNVPHTWNASDGADGSGYDRGTGWYRRDVTVSESLSGKDLILQFAGVKQVAEVWVNGTKLGQHNGGYSRFRFDATDALKVGDNVIAVKVNNADNADIAPVEDKNYTFYGGIYRNVSLWAVDPLHVRVLDYAGPGVYLRQSNVTSTSAQVDVTTKLSNGDSTSRSVQVRTVVTDADNNVVAEKKTAAASLAAGSGTDTVQSLTIANPHLWNGVSDPYMYRAHVEIIDAESGKVTDVVTEPLGLRSFKVDPDEGFSLNGKPYRLKGVNLHQDRAGVGWAVTDAHHVQDLEMIGEMGANAVRMAHYQHDQKNYNLADEKGFVVWAEIPNLNRTPDSAGYTANAKQQMRELIRQNYNHPSIVFWGIGNEQGNTNMGGIPNAGGDAVTNNLLSDLATLVATEDGDRISTYASCCVSDTGKIASHAETAGYNMYHGWYQSGSVGSWADDLHKADPTRKIALSEYGAGANTNQHYLNPPKPSPGGQWHPEEYQSLVHEAAWKDLKTRSYLWGTFVWLMFDHALDSWNQGSQPGINDKGLVTHDRTVKKDAFYWYKANWASTPTLHITSKRWTQRTAASTEIKVYSNADKVTATLNGTSLGEKTSTDHIFKWPVTLKPGVNTVTVKATINGAEQTDTTTWTLDNGSAYSKTEAEDFDEQSGINVYQTTSSENGWLLAGAINPGNSLTYYDVDFGTTPPKTVTTRIASGATATGTIQYRLGSPTGTIIAEVPVSNTGGWQSWTGKSTTLSEQATGKHKLYLTFTGTGGDFVNINWFQFQR
ncbi:carbohydrate-binding protein [Streptomyces bicolor]|uniref:carbohydrate-binding protein n=1 Tax=Streptomyces bicolor TaxID=66874 RepID=UPI0007C5BF1A|nr:carbohydrate-binding protein [Streptomyces bicolor]